jgi:formate-dependent phosphoribosylglycinamide formyltransferase (GAR transformylase)
MNDYKNKILENICYTELVYERINKKLNMKLSKDKIEEMIFEIFSETDNTEFRKTGKNIYITNKAKRIRLTINSYTNRLITADKLDIKTSRYNFIDIS